VVSLDKAERDRAADREFLRRYPPLGGDPALDFANTVAWRLRPRPEEGLPDYPALLRWARLAGLIDAADAAVLAARALAEPEVATAALDRARALREAIDRAFAAVAVGEAPSSADLERVSAVAAEGAGRARLRAEGGGFAWGWRGEDATALDRPAWEVSWKAVRLLLSRERALVRRCGGEGCGWLFVDRSRNGRRRWCDMATCGNRARVKAHYRRTHRAPAGGGPA
jgi:predicted RNA-binding Zn ribbon-like protein